MIKFKQLREKTKIARATVDSGEETKLNDLPSDESQLDDINTNGRNPDGNAESQVNKSIKPIYVKTSDGTYTLATESYANTKTAILTQMKPKTDKERVARIAELQKRAKKGDLVAASHLTPNQKGRKRERGDVVREDKTNEEVVNENTIDDIKKIVTLDQPGTVRFSDGSSAKIRPESAQAILMTHGNLNTNNQRKFAEKLSASASGFSKLEKFSLQQAKLSGRLYQLNNL